MLANRRQLLKSAVAAGALRLPAQQRAGIIAEYDPLNIKVAHRLDAKAITDDDLLFLQQIGLRWVRLEFGEGDTTFESLRAVQQRYARFGLSIYSAVHSAYRSGKAQLGQPGRDQATDTSRRFLRDIGKLEIPVASYDFHPGNTYTTNYVQRRGYTSREFDLNDFRGKVEKQRFEREYSADDIWASYTYFMKAVLPVAEESGVKLALHPDDPPVAKMNGVAKIFTNYEGYRRARAGAGGRRPLGPAVLRRARSGGGRCIGR